MAVVLVGIGYTNFSANPSGVKDLENDTLAVSSMNHIGDVQLVSSSATIVENEKTNTSAVSKQQEVSNDALVSNDEEQEETTRKPVNDFSELKIDRDEMYSRSLETYQKIIDSENISNEQKAIAMQEIEKINNTKNAIQMAEKIIQLKGFEDVVIYSSNNKISVIVRIAVLSDAQVAQIQNIVSKELGVEIADITISNK